MRLLRVLAIPLLLLCAGVLWFTRPRLDTIFGTSGGENETLACQSNLRKIALAFAHYAQDFDGKFPRGVDPEDRLPDTWRDNYTGKYSDDAQTAPFLQQLLLPYLKEQIVWRCPSDSGWAASREAYSSRLQAVTPSSFQKFGTSYYYYTIHGFASLRPSDVPDASREILLFDGDLWHRTGNVASLNAMFADGHVENLTSEKFNELGSEQSEFLETLSIAR